MVASNSFCRVASRRALRPSATPTSPRSLRVHAFRPAVSGKLLPPAHRITQSPRNCKAAAGMPPPCHIGPAGPSHGEGGVEFVGGEAAGSGGGEGGEGQGE